MRRPVEISATTPHQVGVLRRTSAGYDLHASKGERGTLFFGPHLALEEGNYRVIFRLELGAAEVLGGRSRAAGRIDVNVVQAGKRRELARQDLDARSTATVLHDSLHFVVQPNPHRAAHYEFRVHTSGLTELTLKSVTLEEI